LPSKEKEEAGEPRGRQQRKRKRKTIEPRNKPLLFTQRKAGPCGPVITVTAEWSVHGFAGTEKRAVWRKPTPSRRRQRTTMKACLFTVTKCHKNAQSHRAPTCAPTPARCRVHSRARRRQLRVPPPTARATTGSTHPHIQIIIQMFNGKPLRRKRSSTHTTWSHVTYSHTATCAHHNIKHAQQTT
jgi:hypothetical protein